MTTPSPNQIRSTIDELGRTLGRVHRWYVQVHDWAHSSNRGQAGASEDAKIEGRTVTPSRRPPWEQKPTDDVVLSRAKERARGNVRMAAEHVRSALDELRSAQALLADAVKDPPHDRFEDERRMARMNVGRVPDEQMAKLRAAQRRREERGEGTG